MALTRDIVSPPTGLREMRHMLALLLAEGFGRIDLYAGLTLHYIHAA